MSGKVCLQSAKISPAKSSAAANLVSSSAFDHDGSSTSMAKHTASEIAAYSSVRTGAKGGSTKYSPELKGFYRTEKSLVIDAKAAKKPKSKKASPSNPEPRATPHKPPRITPNAGTQTPRGFALPPSVKPKPSTDETAPPLKGIVQQHEAQKRKSARTPGGATRAATSASSSKTSTPRSSYQQHIEELEKNRAILCSLKREYGRGKADYERSENTLQCLRRQDQHPLRFWRKQKTSAERSLGQTARKLQKTRILERNMVIKINEDEKVLLSQGEKLAAWRRNGKDHWKELSVASG